MVMRPLKLWQSQFSPYRFDWSETFWDIRPAEKHAAIDFEYDL